MSVADEILRLQQAKSDLATSIAAKGVTVPAATTIDGYAALVDQIQQGGGTLPYDAEVEWIKSDGNAFIDTGIYGGSKVRIECSIYTESGSQGVVFGEYQKLSAADTTTRCCVQITSSNNTATYSFFQNTNTTALSITKNINKWLNIIADWKVGSFQVGETMSTGTVVSYQDSTNIYLFARRRNVYSGGATFDNVCTNTRLKLPRIYVYNILVRDYIAVRVGQVGYMYDRVSGELFGNANSTGSFTLGPDVT